MCVNNLPKVVTWQCPDAELNLRLWVTSGLQVRHVTIRLPSHTNHTRIEYNGDKPIICDNTRCFIKKHPFSFFYNSVECKSIYIYIYI